MSVEEVVNKSINWGQEGTWVLIPSQVVSTDVLGSTYSAYARIYFLRAPEKIELIRKLKEFGHNVYRPIREKKAKQS